MFDRFGRTIDYLRVSVTDRCNLRCEYCMPAEGVALVRRADILTFEEIAQVVTCAVGLGIRKVRLTGGEPLVRKGIATLVSMLAGIPGVQDLAMTTNATLLAAHAEALKRAGLQRLNISLDSLDPERYRAITRGGTVADALAGIAAAEAAGFTTIKLNCVVEQSREEPDARGVAAFAAQHGLAIRFITRMKLDTGHFSTVDGGEGGNCRACNRLRLTSDGRIFPCLFNDCCFSIRERGIEQALRAAIAHKPERGERASHWICALGG